MKKIVVNLCTMVIISSFVITNLNLCQQESGTCINPIYNTTLSGIINRSATDYQITILPAQAAQPSLDMTIKKYETWEPAESGSKKVTFGELLGTSGGGTITLSLQDSSKKQLERIIIQALPTYLEITLTQGSDALTNSSYQMRIDLCKIIQYAGITENPITKAASQRYTEKSCALRLAIDPQGYPVIDAITFGPEGDLPALTVPLERIQTYITIQGTPPVALTNESTRGVPRLV